MTAKKPTDSSAALSARFTLSEHNPSPRLIAELYAVSQDADKRFADHDYGHLLSTDAENNLIPDEFSAIFHHNDRFSDVFVLRENKSGQAIGFAVAADCDGVYWLKQMSVLCDFGQNGLGRALLGAVIERANWAYYAAIGLSTFKNIPFNAPFYHKHGFMDVDPDALPKAIIEQFLSEIPDGTARSDRIIMMKRL